MPRPNKLSANQFFPVVGIGASAGGLEAITALISSVPPDSGMAFLIVQHLSPEHESMLGDIISKKTDLTVSEAVDGETITQNHVYVIPPNTTMTVSDGKLAIKRRDDRRRPPMPVDDLFCSLAEEYGPDAVGVILSGSGSDGALGMQAIKGEGGITLVQDDMSARFNGMPQAAITMGNADFILPPEKIAEQLVHIAEHPSLQAEPMQLEVERLSIDEKGLSRIFQLLNEAFKVDFKHYKRGTVTRRLMRRMAFLNLQSLSAYTDYLKEHPEELRSLYQDLLIQVTSFFRDPESFAGLKKHVFPKLVEASSQTSPLRIWVPGCSSGEEVYSLAISLLEYLDGKADKLKIQFFGTDISEAALEAARKGVYLENISRDVSKERLERFFVECDGGYRICQSIRELCVFARHNVASDPPFSQLGLISCRNLLIYLDTKLQKQVIPLFHYALKPCGFLMLGPSETVGSFSDLFRPSTEEKFKIYSKNSVPSRSHLQYLDRREAVKPKEKVEHEEPASEPEKVSRHGSETERIIQERYVPAGVLCDENLNILEFRGDTSPYLVQRSGTPTTNLQHLARPGLLIDLKKAVTKVAESHVPVSRTAMRVDKPTGTQAVKIEVFPISQGEGDHWFLVFFSVADTHPVPLKAIRRLFATFVSRRPQSDKDLEIQQLRGELDATREHIRVISDEHESAIEELKASQEELLSSNEEFQSTNEELETAKEELQSSNEEILTTNDELRDRNAELDQLNRKLEQARDYADAIIETTREPLLVLDGKLRVSRANTSFYNLFNLSPKEVEKSHFYQIGNGQWDIPTLRDLLEKVLPRETSFHDHEITASFPDIGERTMLLNGQHLAWEEEPLILLSIEDITERKAAIDFLKESGRRKDEFLAMLAHELRNPLEPIRNAMEIWRHGDGSKAEEKEAQEIMERQLQKITRLVDDLLDVARITRGAIALAKEPVDLVQMVKQAVDSTRYLYEAREHDLSIDLPHEPLIVDGDAVRLEQIVSNLLTNAAKYTGSGGRIDLTLDRQNKEAVLTVTDNGIGISPDLMSRIFDLFVQAEAGIDRSQGGLGIGLTLVRRLVEMHGGTIEAKSAGLKQGSTFIVRLPLSKVRKVPSAKAPSASKKTLSRRILVVDDNADSLKISSMLLQMQGHEVKTAMDGKSAIKLAKKFSPEVILLDIGLPDMDGYEVAEQLRQQPEAKDALLIALSGYGKPEDKEHSREAGFDFHMVKPADTEQLKSIIADYK